MASDHARHIAVITLHGVRTASASPFPLQRYSGSKPYKAPDEPISKQFHQQPSADYAYIIRVFH